MKDFIKKAAAIWMAALICFSLLPSMQTQAANITNPPVFSETQIRAKMNTLISKLSNRYFTTNQRPAGDVSDTCDAAKVAASSWLIELLNDGNYDTFTAVNFPSQYYTTAGGTVYKGGYSGYSCWGFANFAEYYLYSSCSTDNLVGEMIYSGSASIDAIRRYARTGDIIRFGSSSGHSIIFYSIVDGNTILALDSNWYDDCMVTFGERSLNTLSRYGSRMMTITRASNYEASVPSTPQEPSEGKDEEGSGDGDQGNGDQDNQEDEAPSDSENDTTGAIQVGDVVEVTSGGLNLRSAATTSSSVLTVLPNRAQAKIRKLSADGYWAEVTYNNYTGWIFLNYVKKVDAVEETTPGSQPEEQPVPETPVENQKTTRLVEVTAAGLNCREGSSTNFKVIQVLKKGTQVEITEISANGLWGKCEYAGKTGWISLNYTKTIEVRQPEDSQPENSKPESSQPESSKPESSKPESSKPESSQPESSQPENSQPESSQPESSKPESSQPEESKPEAAPSTGRLVEITGNWLNVRKGPHTDYEKIGELSKGDQVLILETTEDGGWGRFLMNGKDAWIFLYYTKDVNTGNSQPENTQPEVTQPSYETLPYNAFHHVTASLGLNMREKPSVDSKVIHGVPYDHDVLITEITKDGIWGKTTWDGYTGWINLQYTRKVEEDLPAPSQPTSKNEYRQVTATLGLNMRQEPSIDSKVIYGVPFTYKVLITEISSDGVWGKTTLDGYTGWINLNYTKVVTSDTN